MSVSARAKPTSSTSSTALNSAPTRSTGLRAAALLGLLCLVALAQDVAHQLPGADWKLKVPEPVAQSTTAMNPAWNELDCARCHETIAREWAQTRHGQAWNNEVYQEELATILKKSKCTSCHAPKPLLVAGIDERVVVREEGAHFGVDCNSCHLGADGSIQGPWGAATEAHRSTKNDLFSLKGSNELCLACHSRSVGPVIGIGRDFDDEELAQKGFSCVGCHMQPVKRPIASGEALTDRVGRSHHLQTPRDPSFLRQAFLVQVERSVKGARVTISNRAGHRIPGLNDRILVFQLELLDGAGEVIATDEIEVSRSEPLHIAQSISLQLPGEGATQLRVEGVHEAKSLEGNVVFLRETFELAQ